MRHRQIEIIMLLGGIIVIALGAVIENLINIPEKWEAETRTGVVALGTALTIAGLLSLTVDRQLKDEIAQDAFRFVMGWVSPERLRLKAELESVYRQPLFAVESDMTVNLSERPSGFTRMTLEIQRTIRNDSLRSQPFPATFGLRNWAEPGRESAVTEISAHFKGITYSEREKTPPDGIKLPGESLGERLKKPIILAKKDEVTVSYKGYEDKLSNDIHWEVFLTPTENPTVTVVSANSVGVYVEFHSTGEQVSEGESITGDIVTRRWRLNGVMLPSQAISIRWWPKDLYSF